MNKIGITNFWTNLQQLQEIEDCEVTVTTQQEHEETSQDIIQLGFICWCLFWYIVV